MYQGDIVYIIKYQLLLLERIQGGYQGSEDPTKTHPCHDNLCTIENCERFKCDGRVLERNDS